MKKPTQGEKTTIVYHGSPIAGLEEINPRVSTHQEPRVYATPSKAVALSMMGKNCHDMVLHFGIWNEIYTIVERIANVFDHAYDGRGGSLYHLDASGFIKGQTSRDQEVISPQKQNVVDEEIISDLKQAIMQLHNEGAIQIFLYPNKPTGREKEKGKNDEDILDMIDYYPKKDYLGCIEEYHPHLLEKAKERCKKK